MGIVILITRKKDKQTIYPINISMHITKQPSINLIHNIVTKDLITNIKFLAIGKLNPGFIRINNKIHAFILNIYKMLKPCS